MNASVKLAYIATPSVVTRFNELDCVRLLRSSIDMDDKLVPAGSVGTIVAVWGGGEAFEVEFVEPFQALVTVRVEDLALEQTFV